MYKHKGFFHTVMRKKSIILVISAFLFVSGIAAYLTLPKQEYPVLKVPIAIVTTVYPGASAEDVEELVTKKIEDEAMATKGFNYCSSYSYDNISVVQIYLKMELNASEQTLIKDELRNRIEDLQKTELPSGVSYLNFATDIDDTAGLILAFTGESQSNAELSQRARELKSILKAMPGVYKVEVDGETEEQIEITVDTDKLNRMDMSFNELVTLVTYQNSFIPAGNITFDTDKITVNTSGKFESIEEIKDIIVGVSPSTGAVTMLKDIAAVEKAQVEDAKLYRFDEKNAVLLNLYYQDGINVVSAGSDIIKRVDEYKKGLPEGIEINTVINLADDVNNSVLNFTSSVVQAIIIVLVVIMLGMSLRNGGIVAVAIPVSIMVPFLVMAAMGIDVQFVSLAALIIALGMLVDNAVVVSDAIQVRIDDDEDRLSACVNGVKSVALPVMASTLTTVSMFSMFYFLSGVIYEFVFSLPTIVISALLASYVVSILVTPVMCYLLMKKTDPRKANRVTLLDRVKVPVSKLLNIAFNHKFTAIAAAFAILAVSLGLLTTISLEFLPKAEKTVLDIKITTTNLNDIRKTEAAVQKVVDVVMAQPESTSYLSAVGGTAPKYDFSSMPSGDMTNLGNVVLNFDLKSGNRFKERRYFAEYLQSELNQNVPDCKIQVRELGVIPDTSEPIQLRITGDDFDEINNAADIIEELIKNTRGFTNVHVDQQSKTYSYYVDMERHSLNSYGLTKAEVQSELNAALMGRTVSVYRENTKEYPIVVKGNIKTTSDLENLMVKSSITGSKLQVKQISDIRLKESHSYITRYNGKRCVTVTASPKVGYSAVSLQIGLLRQLEDMDLGNVLIDYDGDWGTFEEVLGGLITGALVGLVGIILVLYMQFSSFRKTGIVLCAIPFGFVGASLGLVLFRPGFNLFAILGMLSLMGVVVNNAIVLVDFIDKEREDGIPIDEACKSAVSKRFRPVFLSTMTAVLGMLPLAVGGNILFKGLAVAFMCGDALSMFFTLIIVPVVYGAWEGYAEKKAKAADI